MATQKAMVRKTGWLARPAGPMRKSVTLASVVNRNVPVAGTSPNLNLLSRGISSLERQKENRMQFTTPLRFASSAKKFSTGRNAAPGQSSGRFKNVRRRHVRVGVNSRDRLGMSGSGLAWNSVNFQVAEAVLGGRNRHPVGRILRNVWRSPLVIPLAMLVFLCCLRPSGTGTRPAA
jgi:hypothetical protein